MLHDDARYRRGEREHRKLQEDSPELLSKWTSVELFGDRR